MIRYLRIAKGSGGELRTQLYIGMETELLDKAKALALLKEAVELSKMLHGLIKHYRL
jgi:four helix bundle protein